MWMRQGREGRAIDLEHPVPLETLFVPHLRGEGPSLFYTCCRVPPEEQQRMEHPQIVVQASNLRIPMYIGTKAMPQELNEIRFA